MPRVTKFKCFGQEVGSWIAWGKLSWRDGISRKAVQSRGNHSDLLLAYLLLWMNTREASCGLTASHNLPRTSLPLDILHD